MDGVKAIVTISLISQRPIEYTAAEVLSNHERTSWTVAWNVLHLRSNDYTMWCLGFLHVTRIWRCEISNLTRSTELTRAAM